MKVIYGGLSYVGLSRSCNQDGLFICSKNDLCFGVVCDGVGGFSHGELASIETTLTLRSWFSSLESNCFDTQCASLCKAITAAHNSIADKYNVNKIQTGTTVSAVLIKGDQYFIAHIGDSRIYKISQAMHQLTQDHSTLRSQIKNGVLFTKKLLVQCVGLRQTLDVFCTSGRLKRTDAFLLCSDGFYNKMPIDEVCQAVKLIKKDTGLEQACTEFIANVLKQNEQDNISVGIIKLV